MGRLREIADSFAPERLTQARELNGLLKKELAELISVTPAAVSSWERGSKTPTEDSIFRLANKLEVEPEFFRKTISPLLASSTPPHFRSLKTTPQKIRRQAHQFGVLAATVTSGLEQHLILPEPGLPSVDFPEEDDEVEAAALLLRKTWDLGILPIKDLLLTIERKGVIVTLNEEATANVDAYSMWVSMRPYIILNPQKNDFYRQRFDLAHELGHLVMHEGAEPGETAAESQAHLFASEFLAPTQSLLPELPRSINQQSWQKLFELKEKWGMSVQALLFRMRRLGTISENSYRGAMTTLSRKKWRRAEPGLITKCDRPALLEKSIQLLDENGIHREMIARELNLRLPQLEKIVGAPPSPRLQVVL